MRNDDRRRRDIFCRVPDRILFLIMNILTNNMYRYIQYSRHGVIRKECSEESTEHRARTTERQNRSQKDSALHSRTEQKNTTFSLHHMLDCDPSLYGRSDCSCFLCKCYALQIRCSLTHSLSVICHMSYVIKCVTFFAFQYLLLLILRTKRTCRCREDRHILPAC